MEHHMNNQNGHHDSAHKSNHLDANDPATLANPANKEKKTFFMETSAFLTSVNLVEKGPKKLDDYFPKAAEINQHHSKLNELISDLGGKISDVIKDHENDFFVAFKNKMYAIMKEMRELKEKASSERHKAKQEARLINLEKERDWFRREALKLDKMCKDHKRILNKLKATLENIEEDRDFFQEQLFNAKKVNKALLMELEKYKNSLMNVGTDSGYNTMKLQYNQPLAIQEDDSRQRKQSSTTKLKAKIDQAIKQNPDDVDNLLYDEENGDPNEFKYKDDSDDMDYKYLEDNEVATKPSDYKFIQSQSQNTAQKEKYSKMDVRAIEPPISNGGMVSIEEYRKIVHENAELKEREIKYTETIRHLKNQIDSEKKNARSLRAEKVNFMMQRNELEEFFLQCIEEVRKDIVKRKSITSNYQTKKNLKRSTSTASMTKQGSSQQYQEEQIPNAKLDQYTATDKRKVIELLMSNENVLLFLYEKLFPATNLSSQSTQSRQNTAGMSLGGGVRFTTDSGIPIGNPYSASQSTMQGGRSSTSVGGSRININRGGNLNSLGGYGVGIDPNVITQSTLPQASLPGMSIQNNIQNLNLNINLSKGSYNAAQQFLPQPFNNTRGATAPIGQARTKKGMQVQLNALGKVNKYAI